VSRLSSSGLTTLTDKILATGAYVSDKKRWLNINIFHFYTIFAFIISLAKIIKQNRHQILLTLIDMLIVRKDMNVNKH
jgi:hypothetical protein